METKKTGEFFIILFNGRWNNIRIFDNEWLPMSGHSWFPRRIFVCFLSVFFSTYLEQPFVDILGAMFIWIKKKMSDKNLPLLDFLLGPIASLTLLA